MITLSLCIVASKLKKNNNLTNHANELHKKIVTSEREKVSEGLRGSCLNDGAAFLINSRDGIKK